MLVTVRTRRSWLPPYIYMHARVLGEGEYTAEGSAEDTPAAAASRKDELFAAMLKAVKKRLNNKVLYFEISNLSEKMFGYRTLRKAEFFPVKWMKVHNSLHSRTPETAEAHRCRHQTRHLYEGGGDGRGVSTVFETDAPPPLAEAATVYSRRPAVSRTDGQRTCEAVCVEIQAEGHRMFDAGVFGEGCLPMV